MIGLTTAVGLLSTCAFSAAGTENNAGSSPSTNAGMGDNEQSRANAHRVTATIPISQTSQNCGNATLAAGQFADLFYAIASHGTLLDVPFIERTLNVQFTSEFAIEGGGIPNPNRKIYSATSILGTPISVTLDIIEDREQQLMRGAIAIIRFTFGAFIDCLGLSQAALEQRFVGNPITPPFGPFGNSFSVHFSGIDGSRIAASYSVRPSDKVVVSASINQAP